MGKKHYLGNSIYAVIDDVGKNKRLGLYSYVHGEIENIFYLGEDDVKKLIQIIKENGYEI